jgi:FkbM family methyltransferase
MVPIASVIRRRLGTVAYLRRLVRVTPDWPAIALHKLGAKRRLPPIRLRDGTVLRHGRLDNPLLMVDEAFLNEWYKIEPPPPADALVLDVGANIGAVSLYWLARSPSLRVHAYEPNPSARETLLLNVKANGVERRLEVFAEAIGREPGELELWVNVPTHESTGYSAESPVEGAWRATVPVVGIDAAWERTGRRPVWLLKIDTEGAEGDILDGASPEMLRSVQNAIVEYHDDLAPGASTRCRDILTSAGFVLREVVHPWQQGILYATRP